MKMHTHSSKGLSLEAACVTYPHSAMEGHDYTSLQEGLGSVI